MTADAENVMVVRGTRRHLGSMAVLLNQHGIPCMRPRLVQSFGNALPLGNWQAKDRQELPGLPG